MGVSVLRAADRLFVPVVAVALLAGVSFEAAADFSDQPRIRLQLGLGSVDPSLTSGGLNRFIFEEPGQPLPLAEQLFSFGRGPLRCTVTGTTGDSLVSLGSSPSAVGMGPDSMGVYNGATGVSCYRISADVAGTTDETLTIDVNGAGNAKTGPMSGYAFNRLELDMEVKGNAVFKLDLYTGTNPTPSTYMLYSGRSIETAPTPLTTGESSPSLRNFQCGAGAADSNQDSGPNDNCRWIINDFGTRFTLSAVAGEGSLEGGGDFGGDYGSIADAFANNTIIYLVRLAEEGTLTCDAACDETSGACAGDDRTGVIGDGQSFARCSVTRLANVSSDSISEGVCAKPFPYRLSTELTADACNLDRRGGADFQRQLAASVKIQHPPETRKPLAEAGLATTVQFACGQDNPPTTGVCTNGLSPRFPPERCKGTVVRDANNNKTILEALGSDDTYTPGEGAGIGVEDLVQSSPLDWACILETTIEYIGGNQMQRTDTVLFWGDARFSRE